MTRLKWKNYLGHIIASALVLCSLGSLIYYFTKSFNVIEFFFSIGVFFNIYCAFRILIAFDIHKKAQMEHLIELYYGEPYKTGVIYPYSEIKSFFKQNPHILKKREENWRKKQEENYEICELQKKQSIQDRIFAYEYEDTLFQIYAPLAKKLGSL